VLGEDHPLVATVVGNLGQNLDGQKRTTEAVPLLQRSLAIRQANFEPTHPAIAKAHYNLGIVLMAADEHARAVEHFAIGLELRTRELDAADPSLHPWWLMLGVGHLELDHADEASDWLERALVARQGEPEHTTARLRFDLARALAERDPARARTLAEQAIAALEARAEGGSEASLAQMRSWLETH
jgi:eukaryotic-like serine/threonine-protein kinase